VAGEWIVSDKVVRVGDQAQLTVHMPGLSDGYSMANVELTRYVPCGRGSGRRSPALPTPGTTVYRRCTAWRATEVTEEASGYPAERYGGQSG
jgi:hypothetical protein